MALLVFEGAMATNSLCEMPLLDIRRARYQSPGTSRAGF
jgi:hypothetical protein